MPKKVSAKISFLIVIFTTAFFPGPAAAEDYVQTEAAIGFETEYSGGRYTVSETAAIAKRNGINAIITSDAFINHWEYGLWPLRRIIKKTEETWSVSRYGMKKYLDGIRSAQAADPDMIIIGGLEVSPFYRWEGLPLSGNFAIKDWHKHLMVIGLGTSKDLEGLPVIGPGAALAKRPDVKSLFYILLPLFLLAAGAFGIFTGLGARAGVYERRYGVLLTQWLAIGAVCALLGTVCLINGYPFSDLKYDQYHGDRGAMPYQNLIDYVNARGGMTFWAHPEAKNIEKIGGIDIETREHSNLLLETRDYTGFAIFHEGYGIIGRPGGVWDNLLLEYCRLSRSAPVWAIGLIDYESQGSLDEMMQILRNILLVKSQDREGVMDALRNGRMYVSKDADAPKFRLDRFTAGDASGAVSATMGQEAVVDGPVRIRMAGHFTDEEAVPGPVKIVLIRDGEALKYFEADPPFDISYDDEAAEKGRKHYYRAEIKSARLFSIVNPVFVTRR